jgi:glycosyltransferase involved in cell wall biosynthesis
LARRRVLYVAHNHPNVRAGGSEVYALGLYEAMKRNDAWEPVLLARTGPPMSRFDRHHEGTLVAAVNGDPGQYFFFTDLNEYDWLFSTIRNKAVYTQYLRQFLLAHRPDVVHFQHTLLLGYDAIREVRNTLPDAAIVYTLHEYVPICHNNGQMIRTFDDELCTEASPRRCHECYPEVSPQTFFLRNRFLRAHLDLVDLFISPSRFLLERYVAWGIPREKIVMEENGSTAIAPPAEVASGLERAVPRRRLGFFGQFTQYKGAHVLLEAMKLLAAEEVDVQLRLHGSNLELQPPAYRELFEELLAETAPSVTMMGRYSTEQLAGLMANVDWVVVPSTWWENSPLVIQEAFLHGRPVICSDIGGMAEKVRDGVDGLHFRARDASSLAETIRRVVTTPGLWEDLREGLPRAHTMDEHVATLTSLYEALVDRKRAAA